MCRPWGLKPSHNTTKDHIWSETHKIPKNNFYPNKLWHGKIKKNHSKYLIWYHIFFKLVKLAYPHYCLDSIFIEKFPFLRGFLDTIHKPGTGNPISIKLVTRYYLKQLLLLICHETYKARHKKIVVN